MNALILVLVAACLVSTTFAHAQDLQPAEREKTPRGMDSRLVQLYDQTIGNDTPSPQALSLDMTGENVTVLLDMVSADAPIPANLGIIVFNSYEDVVKASVPVVNLERIAADENVKFIRLPSEAIPELVVPSQENDSKDLTSATVSSDNTQSLPSDEKNPDMFNSVYLLLIPLFIAPIAVGMFVWQRRRSA